MYLSVLGEKTFASDVTFQQDLLVDGLVNGINITMYESNALRLLEEDGVLVFNGNVTLLASQTTVIKLSLIGLIFYSLQT